MIILERSLTTYTSRTEGDVKAVSSRPGYDVNYVG